MGKDPGLDELLVKMADGEPVDWNSVSTSRLGEDDSAWLEAVRVLEEVAVVHRGLPHLAGRDDWDSPRQRTARWGKYELRERLGAGSFGEVYRAWDPSLHRHVAIKMLHATPGMGDTISGRVLAEGQALALVRHQNIVSVIEVEQYGGRLALCMEFVRGRTLDEVVRLEGPYRALEAARVGAAVCGALDAVHSAGLVHRDVKAHNVMREDTGRIVLMDFGSGIQVLAHAALAQVPVGTPLYMAPELFNGSSAGPSSDVYSVGVLLYFLVTGRYPIEATTVDGLRHAHLTHAIRPLAEQRPNLPRAFIDIVNRALSPRAEVRYATARALSVDLEAMVKASERRQTARAVASVVGGTTAGALLLLLLLGFVTTATYEFLFGISGPFASEGWRDHLIMGRRAIVAPAAMAGFVTALLYLTIECFALVQKLSASVRNSSGAIRRRARRAFFYHPIELRDWARLAVVASVAFPVWTVLVGFPGFIPAFLFTPLSTASEETLRILGPPGMGLQDAYRQSLSLALTLMCAVWMALWRAARARGTGLGAAGWLGIACLFATLVLLDVPYRTIYQNQAERATHDGAGCYITAESSNAFLLFCPSKQPRVLSVSRTDEKLVRHGTFGSLFESIK